MQNKPEETHRKRDSKGAEVHKRGLHAQSSLTLCDPMDCSLPGSSVLGILQARILEWVAMPSSRGSSPPKDGTHISYVSCMADGFSTASTAWEAPIMNTQNPVLGKVSYMTSMDGTCSWKA